MVIGYWWLNRACGFAFEVDVRLAADVDRDAVDGAAGEAPGSRRRGSRR